MFREMRRKEKKMTEEATKNLLATAQVGTLSTVGTDNIPYGVPLHFVYTEGAIYLHCALEGEKLDNILDNNNSCFSVFDDVELMPAAFNSKYKSAIIFGKISIVEEFAEKRKGLIAIIKKYSPDFYEAGLQYIDNAFEKTKVLKIEINKMTGKEKI